MWTITMRLINTKIEFKSSNESFIASLWIDFYRAVAGVSEARPATELAALRMKELKEERYAYAYGNNSALEVGLPDDES